MSDERVRELAKICVKWNNREIEADEAMHKIWKLFENENFKEVLRLCQRKG